MVFRRGHLICPSHFRLSGEDARMQSYKGEHAKVKERYMNNYRFFAFALLPSHLRLSHSHLCRKGESAKVEASVPSNNLFKSVLFFTSIQNLRGFCNCEIIKHSVMLRTLYESVTRTILSVKQ